MEWKNININKQQVETSTAKAVLIKMPNNSNYKGYMFWHPVKLVRDSKHRNALSIGYNDNFIFNLIKSGKGKYNKNSIISEQKIGVEDFEDAFEVTNKNISAHQFKSDFETYKPQNIDAVYIEADESLIDDE